jgi:hypothetical protein
MSLDIRDGMHLGSQNDAPSQVNPDVSGPSPARASGAGSAPVPWAHGYELAFSEVRPPDTLPGSSQVHDHGVSAFTRNFSTIPTSDALHTTQGLAEVIGKGIDFFSQFGEVTKAPWSSGMTGQTLRFIGNAATASAAYDASASPQQFTYNVVKGYATGAAGSQVGTQLTAVLTPFVGPIVGGAAGAVAMLLTTYSLDKAIEIVESTISDTLDDLSRAMRAWELELYQYSSTPML